MNLTEAVSLSAIVVTLFVFAAGIPLCYGIVKNRNTGNVPYMQFLFVGINGLAWLYYGLLIRDRLIISLNLFGVVLHFVYISIFVVYCRDKAPVVRRVVQLVGLCVLCHLYFVFVCEPGARVSHVGLAASVSTAAMALGPLEPLIEARRTGDPSCINGIFAVLGALCAGLWCAYGFLVQDWFVMGPQLPGIVVNLACLALLAGRGGGSATPKPHLQPASGETEKKTQ